MIVSILKDLLELLGVQVLSINQLLMFSSLIHLIIISGQIGPDGPKGNKGFKGNLGK